VEKKSKHFIQQPIYPGGGKAMTEFIYQHLRYPESALQAMPEGVVLVEYDIDYKGNVVDTRVLQGIGHGCDEEACRVVRLLKFQVGKNRGVHVIFHQKAKIQFKKPKPATKTPLLDQPTPPTSTMQVNYVITPTDTVTQPDVEQQPTTIQYTIHF
jgi:TonB family protein